MMSLLLPLLALAAHAQELPECDLSRMGDTVQLLTISSAPTVDRTFGHTGILFYEPHRGGDSAIYDFGHFNGTNPIQVVRDILLSQQQYYLVGQRLDSAIERYANVHGRRMVLQELRVSRTQRDQLVDRLNVVLHGDPYFHYNW
jgi:hypothetical protein